VALEKMAHLDFKMISAKTKELWFRTRMSSYFYEMVGSSLKTKNKGPMVAAMTYVCIHIYILI